MNFSSPSPSQRPTQFWNSILFAQGFRIFFTMAGVWSVMAMAAWLLLFQTGISSMTLPISWLHGHEMLYGFTAAAAAGFLLTATPVWSKTPALTGRPLQGLALAWLLGRMGMLFSWQLPSWLPALADLTFLAGVLTFIGPTLWFTGNRVHRIFPILLGLLVLGDLLFHLEAMAWTHDTAHAGLLLGLNAIVFFLVMTGGHIMPMFTREALNAKGMNLPFGISPALEIASALTLTLIVLADLFFPRLQETGWIFLAAGLIQGLRLARWHGLRTLQTPLLWVLHLGYLWLVVGLLLRGLALLTGMVDASSALHALSVGAMGLFTQGIMARISLTHTGRPLLLPTVMPIAFLLLTLAALVRVFLFFWRPELTVWLAGSLWIGAFVAFCVVFLPVLLTPRPDGTPG
ncbi:MAG: NnrS family protein [Magnetococcus sp. YQC-5]